MSRNEWRAAGLAGALLVAWAGFRDWQSRGMMSQQLRTLFALDSASQSAVVGLVPRPNVVVILADDLNREQYEVALGNLRAAMGGTELTSLYVTDPLCCPSRASLLRGQYAHNHGVLGNGEGDGGWVDFAPLESETLATWLQAVGYHTALVGKYLNGYTAAGSHVPPGWDRWWAYAGGEYQAYDFTFVDDGEIKAAPPGWHEEALLRKEAGDALDTLPEPFFAYLNPIAPHGPAIAEPGNFDRFPGAVPGSGSLNEMNVADKPLWVRNLPPMTPAESEEMAVFYRRKLDSSLSLTTLVSTVLNGLLTRGVLDHTWVIFLSDNGYRLGEHRIPNGKRTLYEEDVRVPGIIRPPAGMGGPVTLDALISVADLTCTIGQIAGASLPSWVDCRSILPLLSDPEATWRNALLVEHDKVFDTDIPTARGVVYRGARGAWKLIETEETAEVELYDLDADPFEMESRHGDAGMATELARMGGILAELETCAGSSCWWSESVFGDGFESGDTAAWTTQTGGP